MTFEEYKQGLKEVIAKSNIDEIAIKLYNSKVSKECNFKVAVKDLVKQIALAQNVDEKDVSASIKLIPWFVNPKTQTNLMGVVSVGTTFISSQTNKPMVEELARFMVGDNTKFADGSTLRDNTRLRDDYGKDKPELINGINLNDIIVDIDLTAEYMMYPVFVKALLKCDIIETQEQEFTK